MKRSAFLQRMPAWHALAIQLMASLPVAAALCLMSRYGGIEVGAGIAAALQGLVAAAITFKRRLSRWWLPIQLLFPPAAVLVMLLKLPAWLFLAAFFLLLVIYWATLFTRVPLYLSSEAIRRSVAGLLPDDRPVEFVDVGSGLGGVVLYLAARRPDCRFTGIELAPLPWLVSRMRAWLSSSPGCFIRGDYARLDLSAYDVVFAYLSPVVMEALWNKARSEMRPGSLLLSCEFSVPGVDPDIVLRPNGGKTPLFGWRM